jgi:hypothetical protein
LLCEHLACILPCLHSNVLRSIISPPFFGVVVASLHIMVKIVYDPAAVARTTYGPDWPFRLKGYNTCRRGHLDCDKDACWTVDADSCDHPWSVPVPAAGGGYRDSGGPMTAMFLEETRFLPHLNANWDCEPKIILAPGRMETHEWWCVCVQDWPESKRTESFCFLPQAVVVPSDWGRSAGDMYAGEDSGYKQCDWCGDCTADPLFNPLSWWEHRKVRAEELMQRYSMRRELFEGYLQTTRQ